MYINIYVDSVLITVGLPPVCVCVCVCVYLPSYMSIFLAESTGAFSHAFRVCCVFVCVCARVCVHLGCALSLSLSLSLSLCVCIYRRTCPYSLRRVPALF